MADNFLTKTYCDNIVGASVVTALFQTAGGTYVTQAFLGVCYAATAVLQNAIRTRGYTAPSTTTDEFIKLATLGEFVRLAFARPDKNLDLPETNKLINSTSPWMAARDAIISGEVKLNLAESVVSGHGGIISSPTTTYPTVFSRTDLDVW